MFELLDSVEGTPAHGQLKTAMDKLYSEQEQGKMTGRTMAEMSKAMENARKELAKKTEKPSDTGKIQVRREGSTANVIGKDGNHAGSIEVLKTKGDEVKVKIYDKDDNVIGTESLSILNDTALSKIAKQYFDK